MRAHLTVLSMVLLLSCFLPSFSCCSGEGAEAPASYEVHITRVCPSYPGEFVTIMNQGSPVDLEGWRLGDGEGSVTLGFPFQLASNASITWCESPARFSTLYPDEYIIHRNTSGLMIKGALKLADTGDEVMLFDPQGVLVDVLHYGKSEPVLPWSGPSVPCKKGEMLIRNSGQIGRDSWSTGIPGSFSISTAMTTVIATPVLYPDEGLTAMVREIDRAQRSIHMAVYIMENWTLARHLSMAAARGVEVSLLLEGQPVGGITDNGAALAYYLADAGVNVSVMRSSEGFRRYDYLHAKYIIFDERRLMVCSENMADSSFTINRGWAIVVDSEPIAKSSLQVFQRDMTGLGVDVFPLEPSAAHREGGPGRLLEYDRSRIDVQVEASARLCSSPFDIEDVLLSALGQAQQRIFVQQMRIDEGWLEDNPVMDVIYRKAECGLTVRILLDSGIGTEESNRKVMGSLNSLSMERGWDLECRLTSEGSPFERLHNKGVIVDDAVLVGSANWVDGSMLRNREMALLLESPGLASIFAGWFLEDWKGDALPPLIDLPWHYMEAQFGQVVLLDATACSDTSGITDFAWDLDGDGTADLHGPVQAISLPSGEHNITLQVTDGIGNVALDTVFVRVGEGDGYLSALLLYAPIPVVGIFLLMGYGNRRIK